MNERTDNSTDAATDDAAQGNRMAQFETSLNELEALVQRMEGGDMTLDESLQSFERGISLFRQCQGTLEQAELRVQKLLDPENPDSAESLDEPSSAAPQPSSTTADDDGDNDIPF